MSNVELVQFESPDALAQAAAREWLAAIQQPHCAAFSGGRIAEQFFDALASKAGELLDDVHFFWADERCVPPDHPESNYRMMHTRLLEPLKIPQAQVHRIKGELGPVIAAQEASHEFSRIVKGPLDFVFLGMGEDGHIASIFPGDLLEESAEYYRPVFKSPKPPPERVTLSMHALVAARNVWVLVSGKGKQESLGKSLSEGATTPLGILLKRRISTRILSDFRPK
jgi:6-phosphogluconolactonase